MFFDPLRLFNLGGGEVAEDSFNEETNAENKRRNKRRRLWFRKGLLWHRAKRGESPLLEFQNLSLSYQADGKGGAGFGLGVLGAS